MFLSFKNKQKINQPLNHTKINECKQKGINILFTLVIFCSMTYIYVTNPFKFVSLGKN